MTDSLETRRPDGGDRSPEGLARIFSYFGELECPQIEGWIYQALCRGVARDADLLALAAHAPATQPPPNLLFAAVHFLLLGGALHPLRDFYPALARGAVEPARDVFPVFRDFCLAHRAAIEPLIASRLTQTNVVQRSSALLPAFARVCEAEGGAPLWLVEIGPSAGLNLQWDRFRYRYTPEPASGTTVTWGDASSRVVVECSLRGDVALPPLPREIPVASRSGIDLHPVDVSDPDAVQWLRALVWPDHPGRPERLSGAIEIAREAPPRLVRGDASRALPALIGEAPAGVTVCVYGTHTLYQFPRDALRGTLKAMQAAAAARPIHFLSIEGTGDRCSELKHTTYRGSERETRLAARCNPHGRWLEWL